MPIQFKEENGGKILVVHANGKLTKSDYENFMPEVDRLSRLGSRRSVGGHQARCRNFGDIERLAIVGDKQWPEYLTLFAKPFTQAAIHYSDQADTAEARQWLDEA